MVIFLTWYPPFAIDLFLDLQETAASPMLVDSRFRRSPTRIGVALPAIAILALGVSWLLGSLSLLLASAVAMAYFGLLMAFMLIIGTTFYTNVEHLRPIDAFYFSAITISTVGYGDITPQTDLGKMFTIAYLFTGIGILLSFVNVIANHALKDRISVRLDRGFKDLSVPRPRKGPAQEVHEIQIQAAPVHLVFK